MAGEQAAAAAGKVCAKHPGRGTFKLTTFFVLFPNHPFSFKTSSPASPPITNWRFLDFEYSGSMATALTGRSKLISWYSLE